MACMVTGKWYCTLLYCMVSYYGLYGRLHGDGEVGRGLLHPLHELQLLDEVPDPPGAGSA